MNRRGFTLIEMILSLVLVGILAAVIGLGIVNAVQGFFFTKMNATTLQKGQNTLARLVKEFNNIVSVTSGSAKSITFTSVKAELLANHTISWSGNPNDPLLFDSDILADDVSDFQLTYYDSYNGTGDSNWSSSRKVIEITLKLKGANDAVSVFMNRVTPRNL